MTCNKKQRRKRLKILGPQLSVFRELSSKLQAQAKSLGKSLKQTAGGFSLFFLIFPYFFLLFFSFFFFRFFNSPFLRLHEISSINLGMQHRAINTEAQRRDEMGSSPGLKKYSRRLEDRESLLSQSCTWTRAAGGKSKRVTETNFRGKKLATAA